MKNILRKVFILCMALTLVMSFTTTSFAAGTVTYDGNAQEFIFEPGSEHSPTDLFSDFKGLMPGESVTQKITVKNDGPADKVVVIYMKSLGAHPDSVDFLSKLNLTVELSGISTLFDEAPDKPGSLTDWNMLGIFFSGAEVEMDVTVQVPPTLGNEYQNAVGHVDWKFKVEEYKLEEWDENHPSDTGDRSDIGLYLGITGVSGLLLIILLVLNRKKVKAN
ncbi:MAG: hypothetical protein IKU53_01125 [Firmicutes bacterium]|nr:hypothetical protein [Bacillota bacterium]